MNAPLFWTLFRKDVRALRPWLVLAWLAMIMAWSKSLPSIAADNREYWVLNGWVDNWSLLAGLLFILAIARLVQMDAFLDDRGFLNTKPINRTMVLWSKIAVIAACFILPLILVDTLYKMHFGFGWGPRELAINCLIDLWEISLLAGAALLPALLTRQLGYFILFLPVIGFSAGISIGIMTVEFARASSQTAVYLHSSRWFVVGAVAIVGAVLIALIFARTRSWRCFWAAFAVVVMVTFVVWIHWPVNFVQWLVSANYSAAAPSTDWPDPAKVSIEWLAPGDAGAAGASPIKTPYTFRTGYDIGGPGVDIDGHYRVTGLPPGWYVDDDIRITSTLRLANGQNIFYAADLPPLTTADTVGPILGAQRPKTAFGNDADLTVVDKVQIGAYLIGAFRRVQSGAEISGQVTFQFRRPVVRAQLPLVAGATADIDHGRYTIVKVSRSGKTVQVTVVREGAMPLGDGTFATAQFALWNPVTREIAGPPKDEYSAPGQNYFADIRHTFRIPQDDNNFMFGTLAASVEKVTAEWMRPAADGSQDEKSAPDIDDAWMRDARLVLVTSESGGEKTIPFDFKDLTPPETAPEPQP